ncbi:MAG: thioesterase domain-containing protein [Chloroflexi bacterium]|nr:thioesterase domain-containing protein [Chloroflexota bacterium]
MMIAATSAWVTHPRPKPGTRLRLFGFPYAGCGASVYRNWPLALPAYVDLFSIQFPGRESRLKEKPHECIPSLVNAMAQDILPYFDVPFVFFGHSMGALIAFELARYLRRVHGVSPVHLFVSGHRAPHLPNPFPRMHHLPDDLFLQEMQNRYAGIPAVILQDAELLRLFMPTLRADIKMIETYIHVDDRPLDCPISAFGGLEDAVVSEYELAAWQLQTHAPFSLRMLPGDHFFVQTSQPLLMKAIAHDLANNSFAV